MSSKRRAAKVALAGVVAGALIGFEADLNRYDMRVVKVIDSDTYRSVIALWPGMVQTVDVRVSGIDTPEKFRPSRKCKEHERVLAQRATDFATAALEDAARVYVTGVGLMKYAGRVGGDVVLVDGRGRETRIADRLMAAGYAYAYDGGTKPKDYWCSVSRQKGG